MTVLTAEEYAEEMKLLIRTFDSQRPRSVQSRNHKLGVSDIGGCPQYAVLMIRQTPFSDSPDPWAAVMGTAVHKVTEEARNWGDPDVITDAEVTVTLPNGVELVGHPDAIDQEENSVTDDKSADGVNVYKANGPEDKQRWQVGMYALGAVQAGLLDADEPVIIRLMWLDRSGRQSDPHVWQQEGYDLEIEEATAWLDDVIYHAKHGEDAEKTPPIEWCAAACPFYSNCRLGDLPDTDDEIKDDAVASAALLYAQARDDKKEAEDLMEDAKRYIDGHVGTFQTPDGKTMRLRWISVSTSYVEGYQRSAYRRLDLRPVKGKK